ncbi:ERF family protein [Rhizobium sp. LC145]|uniref:ERF family protein n=1 Tax=Rhizobium sp. LC145 TaxID=1120688 RepID=UPI0009E4878A|nr:ERF family protein [Rhizobium sp. LC145]TKT45357.1 ERF family protein [Rhizobiaceae bacterium LC148]
MGEVIDPAGPEISIGTAATGVLAKAKQAMEARQMANAVEIQRPGEQTAVAPAAAMTPMEMLDRAVSQGASVETLSKLMDLQERWEKNQARKAFAAAMSAVKAELPRIVKTRKVDFTSAKGRTNYQYEDLAGIMDQVGPVLSRHGLSVRYRTVAEPNQPISVTCIIEHSDGHHEENTLMAGRDDSGNKNSIQQIGSTVTYLQRYTLKAALGLAAAADDDGSKADDTGTITEAEREIILSMIDETESDIEKFCAALQIESVATMPAAKFRRAVGMLEAKKKKVAANG